MKSTTIKPPPFVATFEHADSEQTDTLANKAALRSSLADLRRVDLAELRADLSTRALWLLGGSICGRCCRASRYCAGGFREIRSFNKC